MMNHLTLRPRGKPKIRTDTRGKPAGGGLARGRPSPLLPRGEPEALPTGIRITRWTHSRGDPRRTPRGLLITGWLHSRGDPRGDSKVMPEALAAKTREKPRLLYGGQT